MIHIKKKQVLALITGSLLLAPTIVNAEILGVMNIGLHAGGDDLGKVLFTDGSTETLTAGGGVSLSGGVVFRSGEGSGLESQLTIGWQGESSTASNGDVSFDRIPLELIVFYRANQLRGGAGVTYHMNPSLEGSGFASNVNGSYDDALGIILEVSYQLENTGVSFGLRQTSIEYSGPNLLDKSGNNLALVMGLQF